MQFTYVPGILITTRCRPSLTAQHVLCAQTDLPPENFCRTPPKRCHNATNVLLDLGIL